MMRGNIVHSILKMTLLSMQNSLKKYFLWPQSTVKREHASVLGMTKQRVKKVTKSERAYQKIQTL